MKAVVAGSARDVPLDEADLAKADIRELSRRAGLPTWDEPASACLSSRIPYHSEVTGEKLRMIERADKLWAYQFVVVIDDADSQITDVVRGADLLSSTARQRVLQKVLGLPVPRTLHVPLACDEQGRKLSKQNHAPAFDLEHPMETLQRVWAFLGFAPVAANTLDGFWSQAISAWAQRFPLPAEPSPNN